MFVIRYGRGYGRSRVKGYSIATNNVNTSLLAIPQAEALKVSGKRKRDDEKARQDIYLESAAKTPKLQDFIQQKVHYKPDNPRQKTLEKTVTEWLVDAILPYATVENSRLRLLLEQLDPKFNCPSEKTIRTNNMPNLEKVIKARVLS